MARTLETRSILAMCNRQKGFFSASFSDTTKRIYVLEIVNANPDMLQVVVQAPQGRRTPIDPDATWVLTFWNPRGAYQTRVESIQVQHDCLHVRVHPETLFLARRKNIRLASDSRNPTPVTFLFQEKTLEGLLVDFSLEGLALVIDPRQGLEIGQLLQKGSCHLKGREVSFESARIVQRSWLKSRLRLGLVYQQLTDGQQETIADVFNQWFMLQPAVSTVLDG